MSPRVFSKFADPDEIAKRPPQSAPPRLEPNLMHTRPDSYAGLRRVCDQGAPERTRFVGAKTQWMCMQTAHECGAVVHTHIEFIQIRDLDRERVQIIPHTHTHSERLDGQCDERTWETACGYMVFAHGGMAYAYCGFNAASSRLSMR